MVGSNALRRWELLNIRGERLKFSFDRDFKYQPLLKEKVAIFKDNLNGR